LDDHAFDQLSRALARGLPRRTLLARLGAGGLGAAVLGVASLDRVRSAIPAAQAATCQLDLVANVRLGASAGATIGGSMPGEFRGQLSFGFDDGGAISDGRVRLADGKELPVVGQALGRALHLRVQLGAKQPLILVGTAEQDLGSCQGTVDGMLTGPQPGDLGDWHATATSLGQRGAASGATSGGSSGSSGSSGTVSGSGSSQTAPPTTTGAPTTQATTAPATTAPPTTDVGNCPEGQVTCGKYCTDLRDDDDHCGACDHACKTRYERCSDSVCVEIDCGTGLTNCNGYCDDLTISLIHCGVCGHACTPSETCQDGACVAANCPAGQIVCLSTGTCTDISTDPANCGACYTQCAAGETCVNGACQGPVVVGPAPKFCAQLGASCATVSCCSGACCGGICTDTSSDPANCGSCGYPCLSPSACEDGICEACGDMSLTRCGGSCVDLSAHAGNCGACGNSCPLGGICQGGVCV